MITTSTNLELTDFFRPTSNSSLRVIFHLHVQISASVIILSQRKKSVIFLPFNILNSIFLCSNKSRFHSSNRPSYLFFTMAIKDLLKLIEAHAPDASTVSRFGKSFFISISMPLLTLNLCIIDVDFVFKNCDLERHAGKTVAIEAKIALIEVNHSDPSGL